MVCLASPLGIFDDESGVAEMQKSGYSGFNSASGEYAVTGSGDIGGTSDGFHYVWKKMTGDVSIGGDIRFAENAVAGDRLRYCTATDGRRSSIVPTLARYRRARR